MFWIVISERCGRSYCKYRQCLIGDIHRQSLIVTESLPISVGVRDFFKTALRCQNGLKTSTFQDRGRSSLLKTGAAFVIEVCIINSNKAAGRLANRIRKQTATRILKQGTEKRTDGNQNSKITYNQIISLLFV